jgi:hypothetical protein
VEAALADQERWQTHWIEVALASAALAELRHGNRNTGIETLKRSLHRG